MRRRVVSKGTGRRTVAGADAATAVTLDDRPLQLQLSRDQKRLIAVLPYEVWVVHAETLDIEKTIELASPKPSVFEAEEDGVLWLGGQHLFRGSLYGGAANKVGSKLGGFVDRVCMVRPRLLCGVGSHGEVLLDLEHEEVVHRRKAADHEIMALIPTADGRALWVNGESHAWVIDPDHLSGYMKLKLRDTSPCDVAAEAIVRAELTASGGCLMGARDGAVAWTNRALRIEGEVIPAGSVGETYPLDLDANERWVYVLRPGGTVHRFLVAQPDPDPDAKEEPEPLPDAQKARLRWPASGLAVLPAGRLALAGPQSSGQLGRLWCVEVDALPWEPLALGKRQTVGQPGPQPASKAPSFVPTRSKLKGAPIGDLKVDDVLAGKNPFWVTRGQGSLIERPVAAREPSDVLPGDALLLPAMFRFHEGTARPGLVLWPGVAGDRPVLDPVYLAWGDRPRGWMPLDTPAIRAQGWGRREVFPLEIALPHRPPEVAGRRPQLSARWDDRELFDALVKECKKLLKVIW